MTAPSYAFEDFLPGTVMTFGSRTITREEVFDYASRYDPQPFHLDEAAAKASMLGGLAASGWHSCAILMRMNCDAVMNDSTSLGAPGVDEVKWLRPVFVGDTMTVTAEILDARVSRSKPDRGIVKFRFVMKNQRGETALTQVNSVFFGRRHPEGRPHA